VGLAGRELKGRYIVGLLGDTSRNGILCTLTTAADRWGVQTGQQLTANGT